MQWCSADQHAVRICIEPLPGSNVYAHQGNHHITLPLACAGRRHGHQGSGTNTDISRRQFGLVTNTTINDHTGPTIFGCCCSKIAAQQCAMK